MTTRQQVYLTPIGAPSQHCSSKLTRLLHVTHADALHRANTTHHINLHHSTSLYLYHIMSHHSQAVQMYVLPPTSPPLKLIMMQKDGHGQGRDRVPAAQGILQDQGQGQVSRVKGNRSTQKGGKSCHHHLLSSSSSSFILCFPSPSKECKETTAISPTGPNGPSRCVYVRVFL